MTRPADRTSAILVTDAEIALTDLKKWVPILVVAQLDPVYPLLKLQAVKGLIFKNL